MAIILDRSEFFALANLLQAGPILGLDATKLIPESPPEQQALYDKGRDQLLARDLLRRNNRNEIEIEEGLHEITLALIEPQNALMAVRIVPGRGRQLICYYERNGGYVEQTFPSESQHQIGTLDSPDAVTERLLSIFPIDASPTPDQQFACTLQPLLHAFQLASDGRQSEIAQAMDAAQPSDPALARQLAQALAEAEFLGNISLLKLIPERTTQSHDIAFVQSPAGAWGVTATKDPQIMRVERMDGAALRATLLAGLVAMRQPA
jgi:hypothetical protein